MTVLAAIALAFLLILLIVGYCYWMNEGGIFGFIMAWNMVDAIGSVAHALVVLIASLLSNNDG